MADDQPDFLTTKELAELLRIKERKVYDLVATDGIPYSKATGKLLFSRREVDAWISSKHSGERIEFVRPAVLLGSHDPLLEWAVRESGAELALRLSGSQDGLERFGDGQGQFCGIHIYEPQSNNWNMASVQQKYGGEPVVLVHFAKRHRGLIIDPGLTDTVFDISDIRGRTVVPRPEGSGSQILLNYLLKAGGVAPDEVTFIDLAHSETDAAIAVREGKAEVALGLQSLARQFRRGFVPVMIENLDLLVDRRSWFEPPIQTLMAFCHSSIFREKAIEMGGYDVSRLGEVRYNSPTR